LGAYELQLQVLDKGSSAPTSPAPALEW